MSHASKTARGFFIAALIGVVTMGACSLNTQPIPPGAQATTADGGSTFGGGAGDLGSDASAGVDGGTVTTNPEAGDGGDAATDASDEDASDADTDAADD
jgi:hypothetical protein